MIDGSESQDPSVGAHDWIQELWDDAGCGNDLEQPGGTEAWTRPQNDTSAEQELAAVGYSAGGPPTGCYACGLTIQHAAHGTMWRICRCGHMYCNDCAAGACWACPAQPVWSETEAATNEATLNEDQHPADEDDASDQSTHGDQPTEDTHHGLADSRTRPTPDSLLEDRNARIDQYQRNRRQSRVQQRDMAARQIKQGRRPRRERRSQDEYVLTTVNATSANSLVAELEHGKTLEDSHYLLVQEHAARGEARVKAEGLAIRHGWDIVIDEAYIKYSKEGGGTALMTREPTGIRPAARRPNWAEGRMSVGTIMLNGSEVTLISIYAISGAPLARQMELIKVLAETVRLLARPFIAGGDWQVQPEELASTRIEAALDCVICAPRFGTNLLSGRKLDYFVASCSLLDGGWDTRVHFGCGLATHAPSSLILRASRTPTPTRRLTQPRPLPVHRPLGPSGVKAGVDWSTWRAMDVAENVQPRSLEAVSLALSTWYAGAERELLEIFDLDGGNDGDPFLGIGGATREVMETGGHRFRNVPDRWGLVGQRLTWVSRNLHLVKLHGPGLGILDDQRTCKWDMLTRIAWRAGGLRRSWPNEFLKTTANGNNEGDEDGKQQAVLIEARDGILKGLNMLFSLVRGAHRNPPQIHYLLNGGGERYLENVGHMMSNLEGIVNRFAAIRSNVNVRSIRRWARAATLRATHAATRIAQSQVRKTASACRDHIGERTEQVGADKGCKEWAATWQATHNDQSADIMQAMEALIAMGRRERDAEEILLPPWSVDKVHRAAGQFKAGTGMGVDKLRPRHVVMLSTPAKAGLGRVLEAIERLRRWPELLREVIEVAIGKKTGGSRLIGLAAALYRLWAKARYADCRIILETRIERPFLAAAPGKGAVRAAFNEGWTNEVAAANGDETATTIVDLKAFYEFITLSEMLDGAMQFGVPAPIILLAGHLYSGPRRIRIGRAVSAKVYPRRSILAGCTWATLIVRLIVTRPIENLLEQIKERFRGWQAQAGLVMYIDDGAISTRGDTNTVAILHDWVSRLFMRWVRVVLRKAVAPGKVACIASSKELRKRLRQTGAELGCRVTGHGEFLGTDFAAGGKIKRHVQARRRVKAGKRRRRLKWLRNHGGAATAVARGGLLPEACFGGAVVGISPSTMRDARRHIAATSKIRNAGSSTTARLALGGPDNFDDIDPMVTDGNGAMLEITAKLWDEPRARGELVKTWLRNRDGLQHLPTAQRWRELHGPVGAAMVQLWRAGASWPKPFTIHILGYDVNILERPPRLIGQLLRAQMRRKLDQIFIERLCIDRDWDSDKVKERYKYGIDWGALRKKLRGQELLPAERHALLVVATGAFWSDDRRWRAGMVPTGSCTSCFCHHGTDRHHLHECEGLNWELTRHQLRGRCAARIHRDADDASLAPLLEMGLPPQQNPWQPLEMEVREGGIDMGVEGECFGDGSGYHQDDVVRRVASWSLVTQRRTETGQHEVEQMVRGSVAGWTSTVPRGELMAYMEFLRQAGPSATFVGDCKAVVDAATSGVPRDWASARNANADLWRETRRLQLDRGALQPTVKVAAHRSRASAEAEGEAAVRRWAGNNSADQSAKQLAKRLATPLADARPETPSQEVVSATLTRIAIAAAWNLRYRSATMAKCPRKPARRPAENEEEHHDIRPRTEGGWDCRRCRGWAWGKAGLKNLKARPCRDVADQQVHASHVISVRAGVIWCNRCGCYTTRWPRALKAECKGYPVGEAQQNVLRRLLQGLPPTTAGYFDRVRDEEEAAAPAPTGSVSGPRPARGSQQLTEVPKTYGRYLRLVGGPLYRRPLSVPPAVHANRSHLEGNDMSGAPPPPVLLHDDGELDGEIGGDDIRRRDGDGDERAGNQISQSSRATRTRDVIASVANTALLASLADSGASQTARTYSAHSDSEALLVHRNLEPRRRIRGKQSAYPTPAVDDTAESAPSRWCTPPSSASWTSRVTTSTAKFKCSRCGESTLLRCRGCQRAMCINCAKRRVTCLTE